jgi:hypothetical protein
MIVPLAQLKKAHVLDLQWRPAHLRREVFRSVGILTRTFQNNTEFLAHARLEAVYAHNMRWDPNASADILITAGGQSAKLDMTSSNRRDKPFPNPSVTHEERVVHSRLQ